jgi:murein DD-endopeptidase MepM/ murein hydrolase activator NlpD
MTGEVKSSLFQSLVEKGVSPRWIDLILSELRPFINFRKIRDASYRLVSDENGDLVKFIYEAGPTEIYEIEKGARGYVTQKKQVPLDTTLAKVVGEVRFSLFEAMDAAGEQDLLTLTFAEILAWEIDFYKDVREKDRFKVIVEKLYKGDQFIQYGTIHALEYQGEEKVIRGFEYEGAYYDEKGLSLRKSFLKAPLRFNRISSRFSRARRHPILGGLRPHYGVDYAAPIGTPVWAVADGTVISCGWDAGFGKQVTLRHMNGYQTLYGHLSRYGPGIRKGAKVNQKQVIGYVGSTGLSTGPHLDYRLIKNGHPKNPVKESFPPGEPIGAAAVDRFQKRRDDMIARLNGETPYQKRREGDSNLP